MTLFFTSHFWDLFYTHTWPIFLLFCQSKQMNIEFFKKSNGSKDIVHSNKSIFWALILIKNAAKGIQISKMYIYLNAQNQSYTLRAIKVEPHQ